MFPPADVFRHVVRLLAEFVSAKWPGVLILIVLMLYCWWLNRRFDQRRLKYTTTTSAADHFLSLHSQRWHGGTSQLLVTMGITIILGFVMFVLEHMASTVLGLASVKLHDAAEHNVLWDAQILLYVGLITLKSRGIWDAHCAHVDMKTAGL